ncbi:MAG: phytanoyl-CoA dioxygenase family protein [Candidatus Poribacteria bacterium]|nr:phytanoyl-CoA dioxygenase family protein [Candidatus Poribacteria bacterium]
MSFKMTDEQKFLFDLQGYLRVEGVLDDETLERMRADMDTHGIQNPENDPGKSRFGGFLSWGDDWRALIDQPTIMPILNEIIGARFRLDHAYGMAARGDVEPSGQGMHHTAGMFGHGCFYVNHGRQMHNGLVVVSYALNDIPAGAGGFCCIPGSHKALFEMPSKYYRVEDNPLAQQIPMNAGDVVIFTEALTHGTMPWTLKGHERRSALLKYCPHYMQWAKAPMSSEIEGLTTRQRQILEGAYVWQREAIAAD